jgi:hypothetical protein
MMFLALGFIVFCIGGTVFMKGASGRSPGEARGSISLTVQATNAVGLALMASGGMLMIGAQLF